MFNRAQPVQTSQNLITISAGALRHNAELIAKLSDRDVLPVLKGNAYGHGIEQVARALKNFQTPYLVVNTYEEARRIRAITRRPVLILGTIPAATLTKLPLDGLTLVISDEASLQALGRRRRPVKIHLEINTGMNRYGLGVGQIKHFVKLLQRYPKVAVEGLMSHLADADGPLPATVLAATARFDAAVEQVRELGLRPLHLHLANTAGSITARSAYVTGVRPGLGLYGINPFPEGHPQFGALAGLKPVLEFTSQLTAIHEIQAGEHVGYNNTYTAPRPMRIGVVPAGYYEGVSRALSNGGTLTMADRPVPITGRVCMNHTLISLEGHQANLGDSVTVISRRPNDPNSISSLAEDHGLFCYSLLTGLNADTPRVLID